MHFAPKICGGSLKTNLHSLPEFLKRTLALGQVGYRIHAFPTEKRRGRIK